MRTPERSSQPSGITQERRVRFRKQTSCDRLRGRDGAGLGREGATRAAAELVRGAQQPRRCRCLQPRRKLARDPRGGHDGEVWDLRTGKAMLTVSGPKLYLTSVAFSPD